MSIHSTAIHNRAQAARAETQLVAQKLYTTLVEFVATDCPPGACHKIIRFAKQRLLDPSVGTSGVSDAEKDFQAVVSQMYGPR